MSSMRGKKVKETSTASPWKLLVACHGHGQDLGEGDGESHPGNLIWHKFSPVWDQSSLVVDIVD